MAIAMMKLGNDMVRRIGGRDMHPESATVGGWLHFPSQEAAGQPARAPRGVAAGRRGDRRAVQQPRPIQSSSTSRRTSRCTTRRSTSVCRARSRAPTTSSSGRTSRKFVSEYHEPDHTANFVVREGHTYMVGSLPRVANNVDQLSPDAKS